ncbi:OadG family protein [Neiella marina]|uniref:Probable oxaloacetate decarboxylase gamma chain n=1 Tax=Neiella holothuriorum TaxID=2870530 RepID=A0ABS7EMI7_9GAMM|nr:OadG family transporter subunit [Neiella holothuriorum]MBW8192791.1 OadG family protein [Neiella holothuriorum]
MADLTQLVAQAANIMALGMIIVFCFLTFLILCVNVMSKVISQYFPDAPVPVKSKPAPPSTATSPVVLAAVAAAVQQHRNQAKA